MAHDGQGQERAQEEVVVRSRADIAAHHAWAQERRAYQSRRAGRLESWRRDRDAIVTEAGEAFHTAVEEAALATATQEARLQHEAARQASYRRLALARARKEVEDAVEASLAADLAEAQEALDASVRAKREAEAAARKAALAAYRAEQEENEARLARVRAAIDVEMAARRREEAEVGVERIEHRRDLMRQRAERAKALEAQAAALEAHRVALLEKLMASVPYAARVAEIAEAAGGDRHAAETASRAAASELSKAYAAYLRAVQGGGAQEGANDSMLVPGVTSHGDIDVAAAASRVKGSDPEATKTKAALLQLANTRLKEQGLFGRSGFTDKQVTGDQRWRFVSALRAAGGNAREGSVARAALASLNVGQRGAVTAAIISQGGRAEA